MDSVKLTKASGAGYFLTIGDDVKHVPIKEIFLSQGKSVIVVDDIKEQEGM